MKNKRGGAVMYCNKCGVEVNARDKLCWNCGTDLEKITPVFYRPDMEKRKKFWQKTWFTWFMVFLCWPVGLCLLWKNRVINRKVLNILFFGFVALAVFAYWSDRYTVSGKPAKVAGVQSEVPPYVCDVKGVGKIKGAVASYIGIAVSKVVETDNIDIAGYSRKAKGKFVILSVVIANESNETLHLNYKDFKLREHGTKEYEYSEDAASVLKRRESKTRLFPYEIGPGSVLIVDIPFEIYRGAHDLQLKVGGSIGRNITVPVKVEPVK